MLWYLTALIHYCCYRPKPDPTVETVIADLEKLATQEFQFLVRSYLHPRMGRAEHNVCC